MPEPFKVNGGITVRVVGPVTQGPLVLLCVDRSSPEREEASGPEKLLEGT
jgi:hypothetical protein